MMLISFLCFCVLRAPVSPVLAAGVIPKILNLLVIPIDGEEFEHPFEIKVCPTTRIKAIHDRIYSGLREEMLVGQYCWSSLQILPLRATPTLDELKGRLDEVSLSFAKRLDTMSFQPIEGLNFFGPQHFSSVHFLVWLPPEDREFLLSNPL
jgi:hypothetical protein